MKNCLTLTVFGLINGNLTFEYRHQTRALKLYTVFFPFIFLHITQKEEVERPPPPQDVVAVQDVKQEETLEAKIRKARPPPRIRISSTSQLGFVSLRLDGVAVTFRNQEVVKDATWDVKTGDRIGLVGPNGECQLKYALVCT